MDSPELLLTLYCRKCNKRGLTFTPATAPRTPFAAKKYLPCRHPGLELQQDIRHEVEDALEAGGVKVAR